MSNKFWGTFNKFYKYGFVFAFILILVLLNGCSKSKERIKTTKILDPNGILVLNAGANPTFLNPVLATDSPSYSIIDLVFNGLMKVNEKLELEPDLAEKYEISSDGTVYTFYLKKNVTWHDGVKFTAKDVLFTFQKILDSKTNTVRRSDYYIDGKPVEFKIIDDYTFQARLPKPFAPFLVHMSMGILPKHILENEDINKTSFNQHPIGTGPFKFDIWRTGEFIKLSKNEHYFGKKPKLAGILFKIIPDENTALVALEKGEIDMAGIPPKDFARFQKRIKSNANPKINVFRYYALSYTYMGFNLRHPFLARKNVRQAISYAIDRGALVKGVLREFGKPAYIPASPVSWVYPEQEDFVKFDYNPEKAKQLLFDDGFWLDKDNNILMNDGVPFEITIITNKGNKYREKSAQIIQQYLQNIGIKVNIQLLEWSAFIKMINEPKDPKNFDAVILGWNLSIDPDAYSIWHSSQYPKGFNFIGFMNDEVDKYIEKGRTEMNQEKRKEIYHNMYKIIAEEVPYYFMYYPENILGVNDRVKGLAQPGPAGIMPRVEDVFIVKDVPINPKNER